MDYVTALVRTALKTRFFQVKIKLNEWMKFPEPYSIMISFMSDIGGHLF